MNTLSTGTMRTCMTWAVSAWATRESSATACCRPTTPDWLASCSRRVRVTTSSPIWCISRSSRSASTRTVWAFFFLPAPVSAPPPCGAASSSSAAGSSAAVSATTGAAAPRGSAAARLGARRGLGGGAACRRPRPRRPPRRSRRSRASVATHRRAACGRRSRRARWRRRTGRRARCRRSPRRGAARGRRARRACRTSAARSTPTLHDLQPGGRSAGDGRRRAAPSSDGAARPRSRPGAARTGASTSSAGIGRLLAVGLDLVGHPLEGVEAGEQRVERVAPEPVGPRLHALHHVLHLVREGGHAGEAHGRAHALEGVGDAEDLVDRLRVGRVLLDLDESQVEALEVLPGLRQEHRQVVRELHQPAFR